MYVKVKYEVQEFLVANRPFVSCLYRVAESKLFDLAQFLSLYSLITIRKPYLIHLGFFLYLQEKHMSSLTKTFQFDQVFGPNSKQIEVYR
jgi:hypothetical protein